MNELGLAMLGAMARTTRWDCWRCTGRLAVAPTSARVRGDGGPCGALEPAAHSRIVARTLAADVDSSLPVPFEILSRATASRRTAFAHAGCGEAKSAGRKIPVNESMSVPTIERESTNISQASRGAPSFASPGATSPMPSGPMTTEVPAVFPGSRVAPARSAWRPGCWRCWLWAGRSMVRFASGLIGLGRCVAGTRVIEDRGLLEMARGLIASLKIPRPVALRESDARGLRRLWD